MCLTGEFRAWEQKWPGSSCHGKVSAGSSGSGGEIRPFHSPDLEPRVGLEFPGLPVFHDCSKSLEVLRCLVLE